MNVSILAKSIVLTIAVLPLAALASPPQPATIVIDCVHPTLPSQRAVADLLQIDNFSQAYVARTRLLLNAQRSCKQLGTDSIQLVLEPQAQPVDRRVAAQPSH